MSMAQQFLQARQTVLNSANSHAEVTGEFPAVPAAAGAPITVLTADVDLCDSIRRAVMGQHEVSAAADLGKAAELAAAGKCAILITDQALTRSAFALITERLRMHEPALVTVAIGSRGEDSVLLGLMSAEVVDRFMLKPLTPALARIVIESAGREHHLRKPDHEIPRQSAAEVMHADSVSGTTELVCDRSDITQPIEAAPQVLREDQSDCQWPDLASNLGQPTVVRLEERGWVEPAVPADAQVDARANAQTQWPIAEATPRLRVEHEQFMEPEMVIVPAASLEVRAPTGITLPTIPRPVIPRPTWVVLVAAVAAVGSLVWWVMAQRMPDIDPRQLIASNLSAAQAAIDEGRYIEPSGSSALQYFNTVLTLDPANTAAKMGIDRIASHFADGAAAFITEGRFAEAVSALQSLRRVQPEHSRLTLLEGQLRNALKQYLPRPPDIATAGDAQSVPAAAPRMAPQKSPEVPRVKPQNAPTREAAPASQGGMLINARQAIARGQLDVARKLIGAARHMGVAPSQLVELDQALGIAEQDRAKSELLQLAAQRTAENRLLEPAQDSAKHYLQQLAQADARFPGLDKGIDALGGRLLVNAQAASDQKDFDLAARFLAEARVVGFATGKVDAAEAVLRNALAVSTASSASTAPPAPSADPVLVKVVEPQYPGEARLRGIEGWVDISFVVTASGDVTEPRVENSSMKHLFARPAINAVRQWKYQPRPVTGQSPAERMQVRVQFQLK